MSWSTNVAANSAVDYGKTASYGSSTPTNNAMVTNHQVAITGLSAGTLYHFRVRSTDASNASATGPDTTFSTAGNTTPPTVSITSPAANATLSGIVTVSASATASAGVAVASVQFQLDGANFGSLDTAAPYSVTWNTTASSNGSHTLRAIAKDAAGNSATSANVTVTVSNGGGGPVISGVTVGGISTNGATVSWTTDVAATSQVEYGTTTAYGNLTMLNSTLVTGHSVSLANLAQNTLYHYRVHSKNTSGVESISGDFAFQTSNVVDTTPPTISITAPANGATVSGRVTVSATASDNVGVTGVQFFLDGANLGVQLVTAPYSVSWDSSSTTNGAHTLTAQARDAAGNVGNAVAVSVTVSNSTSTALQDFQKRCAQPGVVYCQGFDDSTGFQKNVNIFQNASYPGVYPTQDATTGRSGTSLRIDIPPFQAADSGKFATAFPGIGGDNSDFYFQVATRISPEMLSNYKNFGWPTWKNHGFFSGPTSCTGLVVVTGTHVDGLIPVATTGGCSSHAFYDTSVSPYLLQQGDFNCQYRNETPQTCFYWPTNTWITFYYHIHLGVMDALGNYPGTLGEAWVSIDGQPYKKWVSMSNYYFVGDGPGRVFDHLELYAYMTAKDATQGGYPTAHVWWDELIVSRQPIAAPQVPPALP